MEYTLFTKLASAFGRSTQSNNLFRAVVNSINWDSRFEADGELYFTTGGFTLTTTSLDPFKTEWRPSAIFSDGSMIAI